MEQNNFLALLTVGLRIIGAFFCYKQAKLTFSNKTVIPKSRDFSIK